MAPIEKDKKRYIKAVTTVIIITAICLVAFFFLQTDFVRCYLKPIYKECGYENLAITALILGIIGTFKFWQWIKTESYVEPDSSYRELMIHAPIIYLYDEECREATVKLNIDGELTCTYPNYRDGWTVKTSPDGTLTGKDGRRYEYLFWEADMNMTPDTSRGFCVKGSDSSVFLEKALADLGLSDTEANTFIMYWLPQMESNPYNVISFQTEAYENAAKLEVTPSPDTIIRVNMFFYASDEFVEIEEQDLTSINPSLDEREGFVLVEWGGETW